MKSHQIALEQLSKRVPAQARGRLVTMYDRAQSELNEKKAPTIASTQEPFSMNVTSSEVVTKGAKLKVCQVLDIDTGVYVKLAKTDKSDEPLLEVGSLFATEELSRSIRAW